MITVKINDMLAKEFQKNCPHVELEDMVNQALYNALIEVRRQLSKITPDYSRQTQSEKAENTFRGECHYKIEFKDGITIYKEQPFIIEGLMPNGLLSAWRKAAGASYDDWRRIAGQGDDYVKKIIRLNDGYIVYEINR